MSCAQAAVRDAAADPLLTLRARPRRIALIGNANVGKSVLFGRLTGQYAVVSNYPGTTVAVTTGRVAPVQSPKGPSTSAAPPSSPDSAPPFLTPKGAGALAYARGGYAAALVAYQEAARDNPADAESLSNMGQVLVRLGRAREAVPLFERALALIPDRWAYHFNLARAHGELGDWDKAVAEYQVASRLFPNDDVTEFNLARALHKLGNEEEATKHYRRAIELNPADATFQIALAISCERLGRAADAIKAYQDYLAMVPEGSDAEKAKARIEALSRGAASSGSPQLPP